MSDDDWQAFIRTGTNHLIAISGLHIGLVAALVLMTLRLLSLLRWLSFLGRWRVLLVCSFVAAGLYAALADFTIPTQRALLMLAVVYGGLYFYRQISLLQSLSLALICVLIWSPVSILSAGFWFSFLAVSAIGYSLAGRLKGRHRVVMWFWPQLMVVTMLVPVSLYVFQQSSLIAVVANMLAIPLVGLVVVPLLLAGLIMMPLLSGLAIGMIQLAGLLLEWLLVVLNQLASSDLSLLYAPQPDFLVMLLAMVGLTVLFLPRGIPGRYLSALFLLPLLTAQPKHLVEGGFELNVLDVGQGLAVLIKTSKHHLLFDSGPRFSDHFDAGENVILPFLRHEGIDALDVMMISNGDADHIGGAASLLQNIPIGQLIGQDIESLEAANKQLCQQGQHWQWDGVDFEILHPQGHAYKKRNNKSCVLRVTNASGSVLLAADIEALAEHELIKRYGKTLQAEVLIAPHHGSKTSSGRGFVSAVAPDFVIYPAGYLNRYKFPREEVLERYRVAGAMQYSTAESGHIRMSFDPDGRISTPESYRQLHHRYWQRTAAPAL
jgi:competence protein ComEC